MSIIHYELAKQLKDAGFPQHPGPGFYSHGDIPLNATAEEMRRIYCYFPVLHQLIEPCGLITLDMFPSICEAWCNGKVGKGSTPEEAVAKLWLAPHGA